MVDITDKLSNVGYFQCELTARHNIQVYRHLNDHCRALQPMFTCCVSSDILSSKHSIGHECYAIFIILPEQSGASNSAFNRDISTPPNTLPVLQSHPPPNYQGPWPFRKVYATVKLCRTPCSLQRSPDPIARREGACCPLPKNPNSNLVPSGLANSPFFLAPQSGWQQKVSANYVVRRRDAVIAMSLLWCIYVCGCVGGCVKPKPLSRKT